MINARCVNFFRDKDGYIQYLRLMDTYGNYIDVTQQQLRRAVKKKELYVDNIILTKTTIRLKHN